MADGFYTVIVQVVHNEPPYRSVPITRHAARILEQDDVREGVELAAHIIDEKLSNHGFKK